MYDDIINIYSIARDGMTVQSADLQNWCAEYIFNALGSAVPVPCWIDYKRALNLCETQSAGFFARWTSERTHWMYTVSRWGSVARWSTNWRADLFNALVPRLTRWIDHRRAGSPRNITCSFLCALNTRQNALKVEIFWQVKRTNWLAEYLSNTLAPHTTC